MAQAVELQGAELRGTLEIDAARFGGTRRPGGEVEKGETRGVVAKNQKAVGLAGHGGESVELRGRTAGKREREPFVQVVAEQFALLAAGNHELVAMAGEPIKRGAVARGEDFGETAGGQLDERAAAAETLGRRKREHGFRSVLFLFGGRRGDAEFAVVGRIGERGVEIAIGFGEQIGHFGIAVFLQDDRSAAVVREGIEIAPGRGAGGDATVGQLGEPADVAIAHLAEQGDAMGGERGLVGEFFRKHGGGGEFFEIDAINAAGIAGGDKDGPLVERKQIEERIDRQADAGNEFAVTDEAERAARRCGGEEIAVGQPQEREDLRFVELDEFARGVGGLGGVDRQLENFSFGTGADEPVGGVGGRCEAPENIGRGGAGQLREHGSGHKPPVGTRGEPLEVAARGVGEKIDLCFSRQGLGREAGGEKKSESGTDDAAGETGKNGHGEKGRGGAGDHSTMVNGRRRAAPESLPTRTCCSQSGSSAVTWRNLASSAAWAMRSIESGASRVAMV